MGAAGGIQSSVKTNKNKKIPESSLRLSYQSAYKKMKKIMDAIEDREDTETFNSDETDQRVRNETGKEYTKMMQGTDDPTVRQAYHDAYMDEVGNSYDYDPGWPPYTKEGGLSSMIAVAPLDGGKVDTGAAGKLGGGAKKDLMAQLQDLLKEVSLEPSKAPEKLVPNASLPEILTGQTPAGVKKPVAADTIKSRFDTYQQFSGATEDLGNAGAIKYDNRFKANASGVQDLGSAFTFIGQGMWDGAKSGFVDGLYGGGVNFVTKAANFGIDKLNSSQKFTKAFGSKLPVKGAGGIIAGSLTLYQAISDFEGWKKANFDENIVNKFSESGDCFKSREQVQAMAAKARGEGHNTVASGLDLEGLALVFDGVGKILEGVKGILELLANVCFAVAVVLLVIAIFAMIFGGAGATLMPIVNILLKVGSWLSTIAELVGAVSKVSFSVASALHFIAMFMVQSDPEALQLVAGNLMADLQSLTKEYIKAKTTKSVDTILEPAANKYFPEGGKKPKGKGKDDEDGKGKAKPNSKGSDKEPGIFKKLGIVWLGEKPGVKSFLADFTGAGDVKTGIKEFKGNYKDMASENKKSWAEFKNQISPQQDVQTNTATKPNKPSKPNQKGGKTKAQAQKDAIASDVKGRISCAENELTHHKNAVLKNLDPHSQQMLNELHGADKSDLVGGMRNDLRTVVDTNHDRMTAMGDDIVKDVSVTLGNPQTFPTAQATTLKQVDSKLPVMVNQGKQDLNSMIGEFEHRIYLTNLEVKRRGTEMKNSGNLIVDGAITKKMTEGGQSLYELLGGTPAKKPVADEVAARIKGLGLNQNVQDMTREAALTDEQKEAEKKAKDQKAGGGSTIQAAGPDPSLTGLVEKRDLLGDQLSTLEDQLDAQKRKTSGDVDVATESTYKAVILTHKLDIETGGKVIAEAEFERLKQRQKRLNAINDRNELLVCYHVSKDKEQNIDELKATVEATKQATDAQSSELGNRRKTLQEGQSKSGELGAGLGEMLGPFEKFLVELVSQFIGGGVTDALGTKEGGANEEAPGGTQAQGPGGTLDDLGANKEQFLQGPKTAMGDTQAGFQTIGQEQNKTDQSISGASSARDESIAVFQADQEENLAQQVAILQGMKQMDAAIGEATAGEDTAQVQYDAGVDQIVGVTDGMEADKDGAVAAINVVGDDKASEGKTSAEMEQLEKERKALKAAIDAQMMAQYGSTPGYNPMMMM